MADWSTRGCAAGVVSAVMAFGWILMPGGVEAGENAAGQATYQAQCVMCHGEQGRGDGPAAAMLSPKPRDLSPSDFWTGRTDESVAEVVRQGKPGSAMMGYQSVLSAEQIRDVVSYLRSLSR